MSTAWALTALAICTDALEHLGVIGDGETPSAGDTQLALRALDAVLKELPLSGGAWPRLSADTALPWLSGQTLALPSDYYGSPLVWRTVNGEKAALTQLSHAAWIAMADRSKATGAPTHFYITPGNVLLMYPTPTVNPSVSLQYQRVIPDADLTASPDLSPVWHNALGYGVANELLFKFDIPQVKAAGIASRWADKRERAEQSAIESAPICFSVAD